MKKITTFFILAVLGTTALLSCSKENEPVSSGSTVTFSASAPKIKTVLDGLSVKWVAGDKISVCDGRAVASNAGVELSCSGSGSSVEFSGQVPEQENYYAIYPAGQVNNWNSNGSSTVFVNIPAAQVATTGSIDPCACILVAKTSAEEKNFAFSHYLAYLKFTIAAGSPEIKAVTVTNNADNAIVGQAKIDASANPGGYKHENNTNKSTSVTLSTTDGTAMAPGDYYIAIYAREYASGLKFSFTRTDDKVAVINDSSAKEVVAGHLYPLGTVSGLSFPGADLPSVGDKFEGGIVALVDGAQVYVLSLDESGKVNWASAQAWVESNHEGWSIPTVDQFKKIRASIEDPGTTSGNYSLSSFNGLITAAGGTALTEDTGYWTSTEVDSENMKYYKFFNTAKTSKDGIDSAKKTNTRPVRAIKIVNVE